MPSEAQVRSNTCRPVGVLALAVKRSVNWLALSVRTLLIVIGAACLRRRRKSLLLASVWSR